MTTAESKRSDVALLVADYNPDYKQAFIDGNNVVAHGEWNDATTPFEHEDAVRFINDMAERTDVESISVIVVVDFNLGV